MFKTNPLISSHHDGLVVVVLHNADGSANGTAGCVPITRMARRVVRILRLDGGDSHERGDFQCTEADCSWQGRQVYSTASERHVQRQHRGCRPQISRTDEAARAYDKNQVERKVSLPRERVRSR